MLIVRATKKLLRLAGPATVSDDEDSGTLLGSWYATVWFWKPRVVLLVNESTLLPVLMPLAPAATLPARIGDEIAAVLAAHGAPEATIAQERERMADCRYGRTISRSVVGIMNEFTRLAAHHHERQPDVGLLDLSIQLAKTPCSPLYGGNVSPERELAAKVRSVAK